MMRAGKERVHSLALAVVPEVRRRWLSALQLRNPVLFWFGCYNIAVGITCLGLIAFDQGEILGVSRWLKPAKFFFSVGVMSLTMGWMLHYLDAKRKVTSINWLIVISMFFENGVILWQAYRGVASHFNVTSAYDGMMFGIMGICIIVFSLVILYAILLFFQQKTFTIPDDYVWSFRLGLILFLLFSLQGGFMLSHFSHTVGGPDGGAGLPFLNWSTQYGDLRIAHFLGLHALQIMPLSAYYFFTSKKQVIVFGVAYFLIVSLVMLQALMGLPLIRL